MMLRSGKFSKLVKNDVTVKEVLTTEMVLKLSRRARSYYICAYYSLYKSANRGDDTTKVSLPLIKRIVRALKTHQAAIDFNVGFVYGFVPAMNDGVIVIDE